MNNLYMEQMEMADLEAGDYFDQEGVLCCGKCHTRKVHIVDAEFAFLGMAGAKVFRCLCECESKQRNQEGAQRALEEHKKQVERLQSVCFTNASFRKCSIDGCDKVPESIRSIGHQFVDYWAENRNKNIGLLFWGGVGNGKTTFAAAIANALMEKEVPVLMRNFAAFLNATFEQKNELFRMVNEAGLVILDDFGMERGTEYSLETVFSVIDARYNVKRPVIITTNLPLKTIKNPADLDHKRSYDRITEMCVPVHFEGPSLRGDIGAQNIKEFIRQGKDTDDKESCTTEEGSE